MYIRKTRDEWEIQGNCGYGWDVETTADSKKEARELLECYRENCNYPIRVVKKRVKL